MKIKSVTLGLVVGTVLVGRLSSVALAGAAPIDGSGDSIPSPDDSCSYRFNWDDGTITEAPSCDVAFVLDECDLNENLDSCTSICEHEYEWDLDANHGNYIRGVPVFYQHVIGTGLCWVLFRHSEIDCRVAVRWPVPS